MVKKFLKIWRYSAVVISMLTVIFILCSSTPTAAQTTQANFEQRSLTLGGFYSPGHSRDPMFLSCQKFADLVDKYTNGRVKVTHTGEGQIYSSCAEMVKAAMMGSLDAVWVPQSRHTEAGLKTWGILSVPGLLTAGGGNEKQYGERLYKFFATAKGILEKEAQEKGLKLFSITADFPLYLVVRKKYSPSELKGLKLALPGALGYRLLGKHYGVAMVPMVSTGERYQALQQGMIEGILPTTKHLSINFKWIEVAPYLMNEPLASVIETFEFSSKTWNSLSPQLKVLLEEKVIPEATAYSRMQFINELDNINQLYKNSGGKEYLWSEKELEALRGFFPELANAFRATMGNQLVDLALKCQ